MDADQILVLDRGKVAEHGTHAELIEAGGRYASMWFRQQDFSSTANAASTSFTGGITPVPTVAGAADSPTRAAAKRRTAEDSSILMSVGAQGAAIHQSPVQLLQLDLVDEDQQQQQIEQQGSLEPSLSPGLSPRADLRGRDTSPLLGLQGTGPAGIRLSQSGGLPPRHEDSVGNLGGAGRRVPDGRVTLPRYRILRRNESGGFENPLKVVVLTVLCDSCSTVARCWPLNCQISGLHYWRASDHTQQRAFSSCPAAVIMHCGQLVWDCLASCKSGSNAIYHGALALLLQTL